MNVRSYERSLKVSYPIFGAGAVLCAALLLWANPTTPFPVLGGPSLLLATLLAAPLGWYLLRVIFRRGINRAAHVPLSLKRGAGLVLLGAILALPPIAIDLVQPFPADMNVPIPWAFLFYPAIALVAEVVFHLLPLASLCWLAPKTLPVWSLIAPVVLVEPLFQILFAAGSPLQSWLVFCNVALVSGAQLWLFVRYGFVAMLGLRLTFYMFWHVVWGAVRLDLLV